MSSPLVPDGLIDAPSTGFQSGIPFRSGHTHTYTRSAGTCV